MPFLVDSVASALNRPDLLAPDGGAGPAAERGIGGVLTVHLLIHPIMRVRRDGGGKLVELLDDGDATAKAGGKDIISESVLHVEVSQQSSPAVRDSIRDALARVLADVRATIEDWRPAVAKVNQIIDGLGFGGFQGVLIDQDTGVLMGGSDPRKDGLALGW
jgi:glutamate dehydrogenase